MSAAPLPRLALHSNDPAERARWLADLGECAEIISDPVAEGFDVCLSDSLPISLPGSQTGWIAIGEPAGDQHPDARLPRDYLPRELQLTVALVAEIVRLKQERQQLSRRVDQLGDLADRDALTGLLNRRGWDARLQSLIASDMPICVALMDLDNFKSCNDQFGWSAGDAVLAAVGECLRSSTRGDDAVARWGGDEFAVLLVQISESAADEAIERLRRTISNLILPAVPTFRVQCSAGYTTLASVEHSGQISPGFTRCQTALHVAKATGGNVAMRTSATSSN